MCGWLSNTPRVLQGFADVYALASRSTSKFDEDFMQMMGNWSLILFKSSSDAPVLFLIRNELAAAWQ